MGCMARFGLAIDRPGGMEVMFINYDCSDGRNDDGLGFL
jgi:hypothetical protein